MITKPFFSAYLIIITTLFTCACKDKSEVDFCIRNKTYDFLVFGNFGALCSGDCRDFFLVDNKNLYHDADINTDLQCTPFLKTPLSTHDFFLAFPLLAGVPEDLKTNTINQNHLIEVITDSDHYIYGQLDSVSFELIYDTIDSIANPILYHYTQSVDAVLNQLR